jgi:hypothetical protein
MRLGLELRQRANLVRHQADMARRCGRRAWRRAVFVRAHGLGVLERAAGDYNGADTWRRISAAVVHLVNTTPPGPPHGSNRVPLTGTVARRVSHLIHQASASRPCHFENYLARTVLPPVHRQTVKQPMTGHPQKVRQSWE